MKNTGNKNSVMVLTMVGLFVTVLFSVIQLRLSASATTERAERAKAELIIVVERLVIQNQHVSEDLINNLISACERKYKVNLENNLDPTVLLQDVALKIQNSNNIGPDEKNSYLIGIEQLISKIQTSNIGLNAGKATF